MSDDTSLPAQANGPASGVRTLTGTPAPSPACTPSVALDPDSPGLIKTLLKRYAFVAIRTAVIGLIGVLARHNLGWVANILGENVDAIVTGICSLAVLGCHELDLLVALHPDLLPAKLVAIWKALQPTGKPAGGFIRAQMMLALVFFALIGSLILCGGCTTVNGWFASQQAHDIERTVRVDAKDIATIAVKDSKQIITTILADAQEFSTNQTEQAAVAKTIVELAPLIK